MSEHLTDFELELCRTGEMESSEHLALCPECAERLAQLEALVTRLQEPVQRPLSFNRVDEIVFKTIEQRVDVVTAQSVRRSRRRRMSYRWLGVAAAAGMFLFAGVYVFQSFGPSTASKNVTRSPLANDLNDDGQVNIIDVFQKARELERTGASDRNSQVELKQIAAQVVDLDNGDER